jgi:hypothetical protein
MKELYWAVDDFLRTEILTWAMGNIPFILLGVLLCFSVLLFAIYAVFYLGRKLNKIIDHQLMIGAELEKLLETQIDLLKNIIKRIDGNKNEE